MKLENIGSLITIAETNTCLGYLLDFAGRGVFSPDGKVEITKEQADTHNRLLAEAEIAGLDRCEIGQWGTFYWSPQKGVTTWTGVKVANYTLNQSQTVLTFRRGEKVFRGRLKKDADCFNFKRIK
jgi:hypothetical protein